MFGFLKDKLKAAIKKFSGDAKEEVVETPVAPKVSEKAKPAGKPRPEKEAPKAVEKKVPKEIPEKPKGSLKSVPGKSEEASKSEKQKETPKPTPRIEEKPVPKPDVPAPKPALISEKPWEMPAPEEPTESLEQPIPAPVEPPTAVQDIAPESVEEEFEELEAISFAPEAPKKKGFLAKIFSKPEKEAPAVSKSAEKERDDIPIPKKEIPKKSIDVPEEGISKPDPSIAIPEEPQGFFAKVGEAFTKKTLSPEKFDALFWELELAMLENNVAVEVIEKIKQDLREELTTGKISRFSIEEMIAMRLRQSIEELFTVEGFDLVARVKTKKPFRICVIGVNGSGKTTTLAKLIKKFQDNGLSVVVAASDTFRAAAIDQLQAHCDKLNVKLISQGYNADPAAVAFDAIKHAEAKGLDVVLIDTAGRLHSNTNLMAELEKVVRVAKPDLKVFVGESITGNDCVEQAKVFDKLVGIDAIILSKADVDEKGGAAISVSYVTGKPILYFGTGQKYEDLIPFDKEKVIEAVGL